MTDAAPTVSVVMPVLDGEQFLAAAIDSILTQTLADLELLVVDNGSTDETPVIVRAAADRDPRVRPITLPRPGLAEALNVGLAAARAPLVARMDADDLAHPERLAREVAVLAAQPAVAAVSCAYRRIDEDGRTLGHVRMPTRREGLLELLRHQCLFSSSGALMRRDAVLGVGGFRPDFPPAEDFDLWLRLLDAGHTLENLPDELIAYREVATGLTRTRGAVQLDRARRAVVESRLRGLGRPYAEIRAVGAEPLSGLRSVADAPAGLRLLVEGDDLERFATADRTTIAEAARRALPAVRHGSGDRDLALIAYRIATRSRQLGAWARALVWYSRAWRLHRPLARALVRRSLRGITGVH